MSYPTTTYTPSKISLYNQYKENLALQRFVDVLNRYIQDVLSEVFETLKTELDIRSEGTHLYTSFYLRYYFGLEKIPDPSIHRNIASVVWDEEGVEYDETNPIRYDALLSGDDDGGPISSYLPDDVWTSICKYKLDYAYDVFNLDSLRRLLELFYEGFGDGSKLDFRTIKLSQVIDLQRRRFIVKVERKPVWEAFRLLVLYSPSLIGLPYGSSVEVDFIEEVVDENA